MSKKELKLYITVMAVSVLSTWTIQKIGNSIIDKNIQKQRAQIEAEYRAKGILEPLRPKRAIYIPADSRETERQDSTNVFLKQAEKQFGSQSKDDIRDLQTIDYGSAVNDYEQRVRAIKSAKAKRLAEQKKQNEALERQTNRKPAPAKKNTAAGTQVNRLKTSTLNNSGSSLFKK